MNIAAETVKERLRENNISFEDAQQPDGNHYISVDCALKSGHMAQVILIFSPDSEQLSLRVFRLAKVPPERVRPMLKTLNALNGKYGWVKFYLDEDNEVAAALDAVLTPRLAAHIGWETLVRTLTILDEVHGEILGVVK